MMPYLITAFTVAVVVIIVNVALWFRKRLTFDAFFSNLIAFVLSWTLVMIVQSSLDTAVYKTQSILVETKPLVVFQINGRDVLATRTQADSQTFEYMYTFLVPDELGVPKRIDGFVLSDRFEVVFTASNQTSRLEIYDVTIHRSDYRKSNQNEGDFVQSSKAFFTLTIAHPSYKLSKLWQKRQTEY